MNTTIQLSSMTMKFLYIFAAIYGILFTVAEVAYHLFKIKAEYTRKFVHIMTGIIALFFPVYLTEFWEVALLCCSFIVILFLSKRFNLLKSINGIERKSHGSILFPIVVMICFYSYLVGENYAYYFLPLLILSMADPAAAIVGQRFPRGKYHVFGHTKTLSGSIAFALVASLLSFSTLELVTNYTNLVCLMMAVIIGVSTAIGEAMSVDGIDNIVIPLLTLITMLFLGL